MDGLVQPAVGGQPGAGPLSDGGQRAPGAGGADGGDVGATGGRDAAGAPRFDQKVEPGGYLWWYVDALSDDGRHGLSIIAFVGSVFSPYYAWSRAHGHAEPEDFCALNVALYGSAGKRWTMTERSRASVERSADHFRIGPSALRWHGDRLVIDIDEHAAPLPRRVRGRVTLHPSALNNFVTPLDAGGRHRWGPIAACSRVEVEMAHPAARWSGHAYFDSNEGDEPIDRPFVEWDWSRASLRDGSTGVIYDVQNKQGPDRVLALRFAPDGGVQPFEAPPRHALPTTLWRIPRRLRSDAPPRELQRLEDAPFYARAVLAAGLLGEPVSAMHETLNLPRLVSPLVQKMLPWRMPRTR